MKYCPDCEAEFVEDIESCSDCGAALISESDHKALQEAHDREEKAREQEAQEYEVRVYTAENRFEADQIEAALKDEGIPVLVKPFGDTAFDGIYVSQKGWALIEVPERHKKRAEEIIRELAATFPGPTGACNACGEAVESDDFRFCPYCGAELAPAPENIEED